MLGDNYLRAYYEGGVNCVFGPECKAMTRGPDLAIVGRIPASCKKAPSAAERALERSPERSPEHAHKHTLDQGNKNPLNQRNSEENDGHIGQRVLSRKQGAAW